MYVLRFLDLATQTPTHDYCELLNLCVFLPPGVSCAGHLQSLRSDTQLLKKEQN